MEKEEKSYDSLQTLLHDALGDISNLKNEVGILSGRVGQYNDCITVMERKVSNMTKRFDRMDDEKRNECSKLNTFKRQLSVFDEALQVLSKNELHSKSTRQEVNPKLKSAQDTLKETTAYMKEQLDIKRTLTQDLERKWRNTNDQLQNVHDEIQQSHIQFYQDYSNLSSEVKATHKEASTLRAALDHWSHDIKTQMERVEQIQQHNNQSLSALQNPFTEQLVNIRSEREAAVREIERILQDYTALVSYYESLKQQQQDVSRPVSPLTTAITAPQSFIKTARKAEPHMSASSIELATSPTLQSRQKSGSFLVNATINSRKSPINSPNSSVSNPRSPINSPRSSVSFPKSPINSRKSPINSPRSSVSFPKSPISYPEATNK